MSGAVASPGAHARFDRAGARRVVEEGDVLLPGQAHHHPKAVALGGIEEPARGDAVGADRVEAVRGDLAEVRLDDRAGADLLPGRLRAEGAVGGTAHPQLPIAVVQELALDPGPRRDDAWRLVASRALRADREDRAPLELRRAAHELPPTSCSQIRAGPPRRSSAGIE